MNILVAGGAGFIGSHLCEYLIDKGHSVICLDNFSTGKYENIRHLAGVNFSLLEHDICLPLKLEGPLDWIFNLASPASPVDYMNMPIETLMVGSIGAQNLLEIARQKNCRILVASTSEVYGDPTISPQVEEYWGNVNSIGPRSVYDEAKRFMESITMAYNRTHGVDTRIVRIFNTYGPRMSLNDGRALPNFINQIINGKDITVYGDGSQTRSFCYVSDLVRGLYYLMQSKYNLPVNIGNPDEISLLDFAKELLYLTGSKSKIVYRDLPEDDPKQRKPDITKAQEILNWEPIISRREGLGKCIEHYLK